MQSATPAALPTKTISLRVPLPLLEKATKAAAKDYRTMTSLILHLVQKHVEEDEETNERQR